MHDTLAGTCPEFHEIPTSMAAGQTAWAAVVFCGYAFAVILPAIASVIFSNEKLRAPQPLTGIMLAPPLSKNRDTQNACWGACGDSGEARVKGIKVDLKGMKLGVTDDPSFEMLKVLRRFHGWIAFAPPDQPRYANYLFDASGTPVQGEASRAIDDYFPLLLPNIAQWPDIARLAESREIDKSEIVYVLFPRKFWDIVADSIRSEARGEALSGVIAEATIRFNATVTSGIHVENLVAAGVMSAAGGGKAH